MSCSPRFTGRPRSNTELFWEYTRSRFIRVLSLGTNETEGATTRVWWGVKSRNDSASS